MVGAPLIPQWLKTLLGEKFFSSCPVHESERKNEENIFCLDCFASICHHCLSPHRPHRLLQIRRYVYHDVVRLDNMEKLLDCSHVQSYTTNNAKVVFLKERPQSRPFKGSRNLCTSCDRSLQKSYLFCSVACKVKCLMKAGGGLSKYLRECKFLSLSEGGKGESESDDGQMTADSVLESPVSRCSGSGSSAGCRTAMACTVITEFVRKKRSSISGASRVAFRLPCRPATENSSQLNRRKGVPNRSPMY